MGTSLSLKDISLPRGWPDCVRAAALHVIWLGHLAQLLVRAFGTFGVELPPPYAALAGPGSPTACGIQIPESCVACGPECCPNISWFLGIMDSVRFSAGVALMLVDWSCSRPLFTACHAICCFQRRAGFVTGQSVSREDHKQGRSQAQVFDIRQRRAVRLSWTQGVGWWIREFAGW